MVQYFAEGDNLRVDYWKLRKPERTSANSLLWDLRDEDYHFGTESTYERLQYLWCRHERGMMSYDQFHVRQLIELCDLRGLEVPPRIRRREGRKGKHKLMNLLQAFDDDGGMAFEKLLLLPTELRLQIFQMYIAWQRKNVSIRYHGRDDRFESLLPLPPLASTCHKVRREVMPLWYENFRWHISIFPNGYRKMGRATLKELELNTWTEKAFKRAPLCQLQYITAISIDAIYTVGGRHRVDDWNIDFSKNTRPAIIKHAV